MKKERFALSRLTQYDLSRLQARVGVAQADQIFQSKYSFRHNENESKFLPDLLIFSGMPPW